MVKQNAAFEDNGAFPGRTQQRGLGRVIGWIAAILVLGSIPLLPHLHPPAAGSVLKSARLAAPAFLALGLLWDPVCRCIRKGKNPCEGVNGGLVWCAGYLMRLVQILRFPYWQMQHDVGYFDDPGGHAGYIRFLCREGCLPQFDVRTVWQFYHPPLHHALAALWMRLMTAVGLRGDTLYESMQLLPFAYSCAALAVMGLILRKIGLRGNIFAVVFGILVVHPSFLILAGSLNNDMLSILLMVTALYLTLKWDESPRLHTILLLALAIGLGMSTKLSAWMCAPAAAFVFLAALLREKETAPLMRQYTAFGCVCVPLGLWWYARNLVRWGVPVTYIPLLSADSAQYVGDLPVAKRLLDFSPAQFSYIYDCYVMYGQAYNEYNPLVALMKTAVFDEFLNTDRFPAIAGAGEWLFWSDAALAALCLAAGVWALVGKHGTAHHRIILVMTYLIPLVSYFGFCLAYPHTCTQSIRYATPVIYAGAALAGLTLQHAKGRAAAILRFLTGAAAVLFMGCSVYVYTILLPR